MKHAFKIAAIPLILLLAAPFAAAQSKSCLVPKGYKKQDTRTLSAGQSYTAPSGSSVRNTTTENNGADITVYYFWNEALHKSFICVEVENGASGDVDILNGSCHDTVHVLGNSDSINVTGNNPTVEVDGSDSTVTYIGNGAHINGSGMKSRNTIKLGTGSTATSNSTTSNFGGKDNDVAINGDNNKYSDVGGRNRVTTTGSNNYKSDEVLDLSCS